MLGALLTACGADSSVETTAPEPAGAGRPQPWRQLPDPPLSARSGAAIGWTGEEILVVGGSTYVCPPTAGCVGPTEPPLRDGAAFDPTNGEWRSISAAPAPVPPHQPTAHLGSDVYVLVTPWAGSEPGPATLLRYQSVDDAWTSYDVPPGAHVGGVVAAGTGLVVYPGSDERGEAPDLWFDPSSGAWSELPRDPLSPAFDRVYAWNGQNLYLFAKQITPSPGGASGPALVNAAVLHEDGWEQLPTGEVRGFWAVIADGNRIVAPMLGCADGGQVNNYGRCIPNGAVFDATRGTWTELPDAPSRDDKHVRSSGALTRRELLLASLGHYMLDLTTDTWFRMPAIDEHDDDATVQRTFAGAGPYGFAFGGARFEPDDWSGKLLADAWLWTPSGVPRQAERDAPRQLTTLTAEIASGGGHGRAPSWPPRSAVPSPLAPTALPRLPG